MKNRKRKQNKHDEQQRRHKQTQLKKEFLFKLKELCSVLDKDIYETLKPWEKELLFDLRGKKPMIEIIDFKLPEKVNKWLKVKLTEYFQSETEEILPEGPKISLFDYYYCFSSLALILGKKKDQLPSTNLTNKFLKIAPEDIWHKFNEKVDDLLFSLALTFSDLRQALVQIVFTTKAVKTNGKSAIQPIVSIKLHQPELKKIRLQDGSMRTGIRVRFIHYCLLDSTYYGEFSLSELGMNNSSSKSKLPVYISEHALNRLEERAVIVPHSFHRILLKSITFPVFCRNSRGDLLLEAKHLEDKIGYFLFCVTDGVIFIKTFLLLTNNSTPEGERLAKLTGLKKKDKEYLQIDKISDLVKSDIFKNQKVCDLFRKAGCQSLINIYNFINSDDKFIINKIPLATKLLNYISN